MYKLMWICLALLIFPTLSWTCGDNEPGGYPPISVPARLMGPSGEPGQILLGGTCKEVSFFHGEKDDEADWHCGISLNDETIRELTTSLINDGFTKATRSHLCCLYSEIMVLNDYKITSDDDLFYPLDVDAPFMLSNGNDPHPYYELTKPTVEDKQGFPILDLSDFSSLVTNHAYVYLQGPFVNDAAHDFLPEIHPLDAMAYAIDDKGLPLSITSQDAAWPKTTVTWRVCFFSNSSFHRINNESYVDKERRTLWYLDPPSKANDDNEIGAFDVSIESTPVQIYLKKENSFVSAYGVKAGPQASILDTLGEKKLKVSAVMKIPERLGGLVVVDYKLSVVPVARDLSGGID